MRLTGMSGWSMPMANGAALDLLEQIPAVLGDSACHPGRQVALRRWEGWRSTQSASANQCQARPAMTLDSMLPKLPDIVCPQGSA